MGIEEEITKWVTARKEKRKKGYRTFRERLVSASAAIREIKETERIERAQELQDHVAMNVVVTRNRTFKRNKGNTKETPAHTVKGMLKLLSPILPIEELHDIAEREIGARMGKPPDTDLYHLPRIWAIAENSNCPESYDSEFSKHMARASIYALRQDLESCCKETETALALMKSRNNPNGTDYGTYDWLIRKRDAEIVCQKLDRDKKGIAERRLQLSHSIAFQASLDYDKEETHKTSVWGGPALILPQAYFTRLKEDALNKCFEAIAIDPTNLLAYDQLMSLLRKKHDDNGAQKVKQIRDRILIKKAEIGAFDLKQLHSNYKGILTDGRNAIKKEPSLEIGKRHKALLDFLRENCSLLTPECVLNQTGQGVYSVMELVTGNNGSDENGFRACTLEDVGILYYFEKSMLCQPTYEEMRTFRQKKLRQAIDAMLEFSSAGRDRTAFAEYDLDIPDLDYEAVLAEKILPRIKLNANLKQKAAKVAAELNKAKRAFCHGDPHPGNILDIGGKGLVIIDPVSACYASRFFDLAYLLEQAELDLSECEKGELKNYFVSQLQRRGETVEENLDYLYDLNAAFVNLRIAGAYSREAKEHSKEASARYSKRHIKQAKTALRRLSDCNML